jgi:hypothetical protein
MEWLMALLNSLMNSDIALYLLVAFMISEALALIPSIKANSIFQLLYNILKTISGNKPPQLK